jgi:hypothetical protein
MLVEYSLLEILGVLFAPTAGKILGDQFDKLLKKREIRGKFGLGCGCFYYTKTPGNDFWESLQKLYLVSNSVKILNATGYTTYVLDGLKRLETVLQQKTVGEVKFLLLDPEASEIIKVRCNETTNYTPSKYIWEIQQTTNMLQQWAKNTSLNISLRYFHQYPNWRMYIFNDMIMFIQPVLPERNSISSPVYGFLKVLNEKDISLFDQYLSVFDKTFSFSKEVKLQDNIRKRVRQEKRV